MPRSIVVGLGSIEVRWIASGEIAYESERAGAPQDCRMDDDEQQRAEACGRLIRRPRAAERRGNDDQQPGAGDADQRAGRRQAAAEAAGPERGSSGGADG